MNLQKLTLPGKSSLTPVAPERELPKLSLPGKPDELKPLKGDLIEHRRNNDFAGEWMPHATVSNVEGNICYMTLLNSGEKSSFIWRFVDGPNKLFRVAPKTDDTLDFESLHIYQQTEDERYRLTRVPCGKCGHKRQRQALTNGICIDCYKSQSPEVAELRRQARVKRESAEAMRDDAEQELGANQKAELRALADQLDQQALDREQEADRMEIVEVGAHRPGPTSEQRLGSGPMTDAEFSEYVRQELESTQPD